MKTLAILISALVTLSPATGFAQRTTRVSVDSAGVQGNDGSFTAWISADGRFVAFVSAATNLAAGDTNQMDDVFVHDRETGATTRVSVDSAGAQGNRWCEWPVIAADGRFVAFHSEASNLVAGDTNVTDDIFVRELRDVATCRTGTVNAGMGAVTDVLFVNGSVGDANRIVDVALNSPVQISLNASPSGPGGPGVPLARYVKWTWPGLPSNPLDLVAGSDVLGCTVNPTPFHPLAFPRPVQCLVGTGMPSAVCRGVHTLNGPARAPWVVTRSQGFSRSVLFTLQCVVQDNGASNGRGFSTTNTVVLRVR